jgi:hypothetical protein
MNVFVVHSYTNIFRQWALYFLFSEPHCDFSEMADTEIAIQ